jgi:TolB-like protein/class 3 adenylate cyclase/tetratricopeptide (TPR) repeat protein
LAAVLAADVAGYSRLMGADEEGTLARLKAIKKELVDPTIAKHRGRIVKNTGDGMLVEFASAVDAVRGAVEVQRGMAERSASVPQDKRIEFRIGIHVGDIIIDDNDIFGDGVNIAARLEGIAEPGGVCLSNDAYRQVRGKIDSVCDDMGTQPLKNIAEPMQAWRIRLKGEAALAAESRSTASDPQPLPLPDKPSVAVLPFQNMSGDPEQEYFADGIVEDIITALSRFKSLFVIARNSSFTYKGKAVDIKQVGRELGVRYVLEGSVRKAGGKLRITGQLIEAATGAHLWADRFDGPLDDIFELQDQVTSSVVSAITRQLERAEIDRSLRKPTDSLATIDLHYRAITALRTRTRQGTEDALRLAQQSISLDPNFAAAYGVILGCYGVLREEGWGDRERLFAEGKHYALRVVALGADDALALARAANFFASTAKDTDTGDAIVNRAIALNPNQVDAWRIRGWIRLWAGQHERALDDFNTAMRLNPLDPRHEATECGLAAGNLFLGHFEIAVSWVIKSLASHSTYAPALRVGVAAYAMLSRIAEAQAMYARLRELGAPPLTISQIEKWIPYKRREDFEMFVKAYRIAGVHPNETTKVSRCRLRRLCKVVQRT